MNEQNQSKKESCRVLPSATLLRVRMTDVNKRLKNTLDGSLTGYKLRGRVTIKTVSSREVYRNPWTSVREDVIERANGVRGIYGVVDKDPASIIIPLDVTAEGEFVYLIEQFRYTVGGRHWELPQGGWETAEVVPEEMARGELKEETGLTAERMTLLSMLQIAYGVMNQKHYVFLAEGLTAGEATPDVEESDLVVRRVSVGDFEKMIVDGTIVDNCTVAAWGLYRLWRERR
jgi:ADP-ribose pyrophosphatase